MHKYRMDDICLSNTMYEKESKALVICHQVASDTRQSYELVTSKWSRH